MIVLLSFLKVINPSPLPTIKVETGISPAILRALVFSFSNNWATLVGEPSPTRTIPTGPITR